jgi:peptidoglycan/LPS O-acetylase OafA/YrhL
MATQNIAEEHLYHPRSLAAFRNVKRLVGCYLGISVLTLVAVVLLRNDTTIAPPSVWVRGMIVVVSALLMTVCASWMARGSRRGYFLLRLASTIMLVAIVVIIAIPGDFPLWFKIEQGVCGLFLFGVVVVANNNHLRSLFATE